MTDDAPVPPPHVGSTDPEETDISPEDEPYIPGTLVLSMLLLIGIAGGWIVIFLMLIER